MPCPCLSRLLWFDFWKVKGVQISLHQVTSPLSYTDPNSLTWSASNLLLERTTLIIFRDLNFVSSNFYKPFSPLKLRSGQMELLWPVQWAHERNKSNDMIQTFLVNKQWMSSINKTYQVTQSSSSFIRGICQDKHSSFLIECILQSMVFLMYHELGNLEPMEIHCKTRALFLHFLIFENII